MTPQPMTDRVRLTALRLFVIVVLGAVGGWALGRDPGQLTSLLGFIALAMGIGEASNVGKRATTRSELMPPASEEKAE